MTTIQELLAIPILVALASQAGAGVRISTPDAGADVLHQHDTGILEEDEDEDDEPDCE